MTEDKEKEMRDFYESQAVIGLNMAVVMYMVGAMKYFLGMQEKEIMLIAFDIARFGQNGIRPDERRYCLSSMPNEIFTGYRLLAYYYVSWVLAVPEKVKLLGLPYDKEYLLALEFYEVFKDSDEKDFFEKYPQFSKN